jgi:hypothetical protein
MENQIKANAEFMVQKLGTTSGINFGYNRESVEWLEGYIERLRESGTLVDEAAKQKFANIFGSFLGECIVRCYGGSWAERSGSWAVAFDDQNCVFPFAKVMKQIENGRGAGDGIGGFFTFIPEVFKYRAGARLQPRKAWWKFW